MARVRYRFKSRAQGRQAVTHRTDFGFVWKKKNPPMAFTGQGGVVVLHLTKVGSATPYFLRRKDKDCRCRAGFGAPRKVLLRAPPDEPRTSLALHAGHAGRREQIE